MSAQPEYLQASPTVYGFDFNALAGVHASVPDSHSAPVVRHDDVVRTGNNAVPASMGGLEVIEQPAQPPQGHASTIPGYPWEGHPEIAYSQPFMGPEGTSPMRRGGPNVGAYAAAPPQPTAYQGAAYPYATPGTYTPNNGQTPFAGYAGMDLGGREERMERRMDRKSDRQERKTAPIDVRDANGYLFRLYHDGMIEVLVAGDDDIPAGTRVYPGQRWHRAITAQVGTWQENKRKQTLSALTATARGIENITAAATGGRRRRKRRGRRRGRQGPPPAFTAPAEDKKLPGWVLPAAVGGVGLVLLVAFAKGGSD